MRIIDKNQDFYDYLQNVYRDDHFVFDRRDSYNLSKEEFAGHFYFPDRRFAQWECKLHDYRYTPVRHILLQVCHNFWLFKLTITEYDSYGKCLNYSLELLKSWFLCESKAELIKLAHIDFPMLHSLLDYDKKITDEKKLEAMINAIMTNDYKEHQVFNNFSLITGSIFSNSAKETRHIPILKNIGVAALIDPMEIYSAIEEYLSECATASERTESIDLTNNDKIENHGFDLKTSFRGKV